MRGPSVIFSKHLHIRRLFVFLFFFLRISLTGNRDSLVSDRMCTQHTTPRALNTCNTRKNFFVCAWLKMFELCCVLSFLIVIPYHQCFVALSLTHFFYSPFSAPCLALPLSPHTHPTFIFLQKKKSSNKNQKIS